MEFKLTSKVQLSHHDKDGKDRNYISYFLNGILILKQKIPFNTNWEQGFDRRTSIYDEYLLNGKLHQTRKNNELDNKERFVSYPISKSLLSQFNISKDVKIQLSN